MGGCGALGRQTVFHQLDMHCAGDTLAMMGCHRLRTGLICRSIIARDVGGRFRDRGIAQSDGVHTVDGNIMFRYEVTLYSFCLALRTRDTG